MNLTCLIKKEGSQYASLCVELGENRRENRGQSSID
jgi:hypothetical protein